VSRPRGGHGPRPLATAALIHIALLLALSCASGPAAREIALEWYELGNGYFDKGDWMRAGQAYSRALKLDATLVGASYNFARSLAEAGDYQGALILLDKLADADPANVRILSARAYVIYRNGDPAAALEAYVALLALDPYAPDALYNASLLRATAGDKEAAASDLARLVLAKPDDDQSLLLLARLEDELGKNAEAIVHYERLIALGKGGGAAQESLGLLYSRERRFAEAMKLLVQATQADEKLPKSWFELARLRLSVAEDGPGGMEALKKALDMGFADKDKAAALLAEPVLDQREAVLALLLEKGLVE
jgi:tetratricopeptide (TPR) repeat protein